MLTQFYQSLDFLIINEEIDVVPENSVSTILLHAYTMHEAYSKAQ